ncbi:Oidioi.mRNA.OKI2018_I69.XSR.g14783.t1.cds [Oikopleura dioica]|uniref:Oidioi.mRNA.OKI2018_I69.XSR.g14783.t1.cds n=1 Tax=Oikopleura dioica TaxID=34765 RepID=A0ABN7SAT8_OIKDI|nr:Oidioi.mRNA.OKI2018_I69.XSR.g14783.t1.cds [Oikopleura dioica]
MDKYSERNWNPLATCDEMQLSFSDKFRSMVDIGWLGTMWMNRWHLSDIDIPSYNEDNKELKDDESRLSSFFRRIRLIPKFENLTVEERIPRNARAEGLNDLLPQN